jgi:putative DNA primase/helicase
MHDVADDADPVVSSDESVWGTEDALALSFTRRYHRDWRYVAAGALAGVGRATLAHRGHAGRHRPDPQRLPPDAVRADNPKVAAKLASAGTVGGVERLARADRRHAATTDEWDADPWLLNTPGGVVDLKTGRQRRTTAPTG